MKAEERAQAILNNWSIDPDVNFERIVGAINRARSEERDACAGVLDNMRVKGTSGITDPTIILQMASVAIRQRADR